MVKVMWQNLKCENVGGKKVWHAYTAFLVASLNNHSFKMLLFTIVIKTTVEQLY